MKHEWDTADLNGNGRDEIVTLSYKSSLRMYNIPTGDCTTSWVMKEIWSGVYAGLAAGDIDGDFKADGEKDNLITDWGPHIQDWQPGDATWQGGKGKGIIEAVVSGDFVPGYKDETRRAMAINVSQYQGGFSAGETTFKGNPGTYDLVLTTLTVDLTDVSVAAQRPI
jgi:hypothetical protein